MNRLQRAKAIQSKRNRTAVRFGAVVVKHVKPRKVLK
jgi:hypothetical protein